MKTRDGTIGIALVCSSVGSGLILILGVCMGICILTVFSEPKDYEAEEMKARYWEQKQKALETIDSRPSSKHQNELDIMKTIAKQQRALEELNISHDQITWEELDAHTRRKSLTENNNSIHYNYVHM